MNEKDLELHKRAERTCLMRAQAAKELTIQCMAVDARFDSETVWLSGRTVFFMAFFGGKWSGRDAAEKTPPEVGRIPGLPGRER